MDLIHWEAKTPLTQVLAINDWFPRFYRSATAELRIPGSLMTTQRDTSKPVHSIKTHLTRPRRRSWTLDPWRTMTPLRRESWQMKIRQTAWLRGWSSRPRCPMKTRGSGSAAAEWGPARNDPSERWWRWRWGLPSWSSPDGTSWWGLFPLCSLCIPWLCLTGQTWHGTEEPKPWLVMM